MDLLNNSSEKVVAEFKSAKYWRDSFATIALISTVVSIVFISKYNSLKEETSAKIERDSISYHSLEKAFLEETEFNLKKYK